MKCVVSGCPNRVGDARGFNRPRKRFFKFPKDPVRVKVWLAALRETDKQDPTEQHLICEDHFLPEDISRSGVHSDAIPIMPPCLEGAWGAESEEEQEEEEEEQEEERGSTVGEEEDDDGEGGAGGGCEAGEPQNLQSVQQLQEEEMTAAVVTAAPPSDDRRGDGKHKRLSAGQNRLEPGPASRPCSVSEQTLCILEKLLAAPGGQLDVRLLERHLLDIVSIMEGFCLVQKKAAGHVQWIGRCELSTLLTRSRQNVEMERMRLVEETLDGLIKLCARQLFDTTDHPDNAALAYVTHADVSRLPGLQDQTLMVVQAPEETRLEIPPPTEESIKVHLKGNKGPITVVACEVGGAEGGACFVSLEESRVRAAPLQQPATS